MRKTALVSLLLMVFVLFVAVPVVNEVQEAKAERFLSETPLKNYSYWYGLDHYPKDKVEMAFEVEKLVDNGMEVDAACQQVINANSDKIYAETVEFFSSMEDDWETDTSERFAKFIDYVDNKQN